MTKIADKACSENVKSAGRIFNEYGDFIYNVIYNQVKDEHLAKDIYQNYFLSLVSKPIPDSTRNVKAYIYQTIKNDIIDTIRRTQRYRKMIEKYVHSLEKNEKNFNSRNALMYGVKDGKLLKRAWRVLDPRETKAVNLRFRKHHSPKEVANIMNVSVDTAYKYVCSGLRKMRKFVSERIGEENEQRQL